MTTAFGWAADDPCLLDRLRERALVTPNGNLTIAGALFLTDPTKSLGAAKIGIECRRYPDEGIDYDARTTFDGPLHRQVRDATYYLMDQLGSDVIVTGLYRHELPKLPEIVIRETLANAVAHRSYEVDTVNVLIELRPSRVSVTSPGSLPEPVTVETMRYAQAARNPAVIDVLRRFSLAEDAGRGIDTIEDEMRDAMLDSPRFSDDGRHVRVDLPLSGPITPRERAWVADLTKQGWIDPAGRLLLVHAARGEQLTNRVAREVLGVGSEVRAREALHRLRDLGLLRQHGERGAARYELVERLRPPAAYRLSPGEIEDLVVEMAMHRSISNSEVRAVTGLSRQSVTGLLSYLVESGRIIRTGERRGTRYTARLNC